MRRLSGDVPSDVAAAAVGGYGRWEQTPGSDVDLMFLHGDDDPGGVQGLLDDVLYPLWDSGLPVSHSVRTIAECRAEAAARIESLTTLLDAHLIAGSDDLLHEARLTALETLYGDAEAFVDSLRRSREDRARRFGSVGEMLEPELKEGLGGLRDIQVLRWMARLAGAGDDPLETILAPPLLEALDFLLLVRTALHRVSDSRSNKLLAEYHQLVAGQLGIEDRPDWEARDGLMRAVLVHARRVDYAVNRALRSDYGSGVDSGTTPPQHLLQILEKPDAPGILHDESSQGRLEGLLPQWEGVRGRAQRDPYHQFPADVHLIETLAQASRLLEDPDEPFAVEAAMSIEDPTALFLGALLHDIGKIGRGSHVQTGIDVATRALDHVGVEGERRDDVLFLVGEHLLLSDTATRRNLEDEDLVLHVAARIGDERRLALLYLLTVADANATGPTASSSWRLGLIRDLVAKVSHAFERGLMDRDQAGRLNRAEAHLREVLLAAGVSSNHTQAFVDTMPAGYVLWVWPQDAPVHRTLITPRPGPDEVRTALREGRSPGTFQLSVGAMDRLGLLAAVAGSMTLSGLSILSAQAFTTEDGRALDVFEVHGAFEGEAGPDRWARFRALLGEALAGKLDLRERVHSLRAHYRTAAEDIPVTIHVDDEVSDFYTVVEVSAPDRLGLLFDLAWSFSLADIDVHVAKVATYGPRVVDAFYVRDSVGRKIEDAARAAELERALMAAASER